MTRGQKAKQAQTTYHDFVFGIRSGMSAHEILPQLQKAVPVQDLTAFRDGFYLNCRVIGTEREKYWSVAAALAKTFWM